ncbi:hypothetical protein F0562_006058 [Nyssa sinensis]|uniref:Uncharacterized protein n=1 Tax=Nyssa sinensis TaxID=561372 RepID=A0A5J5AMB2_9ASTE|nr:hypothetical protein F0562_006058 [Nyssa sinensis]
MLDKELPMKPQIVAGCQNLEGGLGRDQGGAGENGTVTGKACPKGLYSIFCVALYFYRSVQLVLIRMLLDLIESFVINAQLMSFPIVLFILPSEVSLSQWCA